MENNRPKTKKKQSDNDLYRFCSSPFSLQRLPLRMPLIDVIGHENVLWHCMYVFIFKKDFLRCTRSKTTLCTDRSGVRESNSRPLLGKQIYCHCTNPARKCPALLQESSFKHRSLPSYCIYSHTKTRFRQIYFYLRYSSYFFFELFIHFLYVLSKMILSTLFELPLFPLDPSSLQFSDLPLFLFL